MTVDIMIYMNFHISIDLFMTSFAGSTRSIDHERQARTWWSQHVAVELGREASLCGHIALQRLGQAVLSRPRQV